MKKIAYRNLTDKSVILTLFADDGKTIILENRMIKAEREDKSKDGQGGEAVPPRGRRLSAYELRNPERPVAHWRRYAVTDEATKRPTQLATLRWLSAYGPRIDISERHAPRG